MNVLLSVLIVLLSTVLAGGLVVMLLAYNIIVEVLGKTKTAAEDWLFDHVPHVGLCIWVVFMTSLVLLTEYIV
ncbi:TMhelix containing protein [Vibrio phage 1.293.O._10N.261.52.E1]|nr:TMhelix containing protein [Vibrio phage 1.293.O._10N.261.52.E1]